MTSDRLSLYSEPYGSTGNIGENFRRLLGAPSLDPLQTVVREALQNIADAGVPGSSPEILLRLRRLTAAQLAALRENVFGELPEEASSREALREFLSRDTPAVLEICDFGTSGLGGPTRADRIPVGTQRTDFIDFLRNIGTPRDTDRGGGTYGFGKVSLYRVSHCSTILVDTLVADEEEDARRLIGCHIGASYEKPEGGLARRFTGRHWWGERDASDGVAGPVNGPAAEQLSDAIGFPFRPEGRTGTSIMILDFDTEGEELVALGHRIVEAVLWNFWPRLMADTPHERRFNCTVEVEGRRLDIPAPEEFPPLELFAKAMRAARSGSGNDVRPITSSRPQKILGHLAIEKGLRSPRHPLADRDEGPFPRTARHIALMRPVELVVRYIEGSPFPDERLEWAGVFLASDEEEVERAFADSEPPAHDDWVPDNLPKGRPKTYVNVALRQLKGIASELGNTSAGEASGASSGPPLARIASRLGAALEGVGGDGAGKRRGSGGGGGPRPVRARASKPVFVRLQNDDGGPIAVFSTEVQQDRNRSGSHLVADASVSVDGAADRRNNEMPKPQVVSIRAVSGDLLSDSERLEIGGGEGLFEVAVRVPKDCAVTVDAMVEGEAS